MLYDGAVRFLRQAIEAMEAGDAPGKGKAVGKAVDILVELDASLNLEAGGEVARNLRSLYDFMMRHLTLANARSDPRMMRDVIEMLEELNESWRAIST